MKIVRQCNFLDIWLETHYLTILLLSIKVCIMPEIHHLGFFLSSFLNYFNFCLFDKFRYYELKIKYFRY